ncbi:MAG: cyclic nucleotide-binding domain-containing protein [Gammaproteobacteria bacterium]|nr:cyclic nucleotide-binding domain-containing protein [Gammaproteobacteria bacterium]
MSVSTALLHNFRCFTPLNRLDNEQLSQLSTHAVVDRKPPGATLFKTGDTNYKTIYLLSGQIALIAGDGTRTHLHAGEPQSYQPIDPTSTRSSTAVAITSVTTLSLNNDYLHDALALSVDPADEPVPKNDDVPATFNSEVIKSLAVPILDRLPEPYLAILRNRARPICVKAGAQAVKEGDAPHHYHMIAEGSCNITRHLGRKGQDINLGVRRAGEGFGERSLIEGIRHKNTVTMLEDSLLLRINKGEFLSLLVRPYLNWMTLEEAKDLQASESAILLDVRSTRAFQQNHIDGSTNMPLNMLDHTAGILDTSRPYIICCDSPKRAMTASFILAEHGISTRILEGGVRGHCFEEPLIQAGAALRD